MGRKILLVDDDQASVQPLIDELSRERGVETRLAGFAAAGEAIDDFAPHIIILDLAEGDPSEQNNRGLGVFDEIWKKRFCPLIFYTAVPSPFDEDDRVKDHPFIKFQKKGSGSEQEVVACVRGFDLRLCARGRHRRDREVAQYRAQGHSATDLR